MPYWLCARRGLAQAAASAESVGIYGTGVAVIEREPNVLRLQQVVTADGKDVKEALAKLKGATEAATQKLTKMGAADGSVHISAPQPMDATNNVQMQRMMMMRANLGGRRPQAGKAPAPVVTLSSTVKAEWHLTAANLEALLVESQELQAKVKEADLGGDKAQKLTPEQEEAQAEAQQMGDNQPNPRDPQFIFVHQLTKDDLTKARAEAYKKAHDEAESVAHAAGLELVLSESSPPAPAPMPARMAATTTSAPTTTCRRWPPPPGPPAPTRTPFLKPWAPRPPSSRIACRSWPRSRPRPRDASHRRHAPQRVAPGEASVGPGHALLQSVQRFSRASSEKY